MKLSRRAFALGAIAAAAAIPRSLHAALPPPVASFGPGDLDVLDAIKGVVYGPGAEALDIRPALQETLGFLDADKQPVLASLPSTFDKLSRVLVPTWGAYAELVPEVQAAALVDWLESPLPFRRQVGQALRQLVLAHCYGNEATWALVDYPGPWLGRVPLPAHPLRFGEPS